MFLCLPRCQLPDLEYNATAMHVSDPVIDVGPTNGEAGPTRSSLRQLSIQTLQDDDTQSM